MPGMSPDTENLRSIQKRASNAKQLAVHLVATLKHQEKNPSAKIQAPGKHQKTKLQPSLSRRFWFGSWNLPGAWSLDLGALHLGLVPASRSGAAYDTWVWTWHNVLVHY